MGTFVRRVIRTATEILPKARIRAKPVTHVIQQALHETFPALRTPFYQLQAQPIRIAQHAKSHPFRNATRGFRTSHRPRVSGTPVASNVGLGSARTFASGPTAINFNVPIGFRALASLVNDDESFPRPTKVRPYNPRRPRRHHRRSIKEYRHFFPRPQVSIVLPPFPETLITPGQVTTLSLPLAPSLQALLLPTPKIPYDQAQIGVSVLSRLTKGLYGVVELFSSYSSTRLLPLLAKLEGLGVLDTDTDVKVRMEVILDSDGQPDILRIVFEDRSIKDVKSLLGESLRPHEQGEWWALDETSIPGLSKSERKEMMEVWDTPLDLIMPTVDVSGPVYDTPTSDISTPETYSWPEDFGCSPLYVGDNPISAEALSASLMSHISSDASSEAGGGSELWEMEIRPSDDDSDVESSVEGWGEGDEVEEELESAMMLGSRWAGSGEGFGFVQAW